MPKSQMGQAGAQELCLRIVGVSAEPAPMFTCESAGGCLAPAPGGAPGTFSPAPFVLGGLCSELPTLCAQVIEGRLSGNGYFI